ncbi:hypothetical protein NUM3379_00940 [Kineococcus sp. NUM-3379]
MGANLARVTSGRVLSEPGTLMSARYCTGALVGSAGTKDALVTGSRFCPARVRVVRRVVRPEVVSG